MELKEFITETIVQIREGVQDAIKRRSDTRSAAGVINPAWVDTFSDSNRQMVEFDVAVTVADKLAGSAHGGLRVLSVELGAKGSKEAEKSTVSRVKFSLPIIPPMTRVRQSEE